jgi:hypothetical protein
MLQGHWSTVGHDHKYISPTWSASVTTAGHVVPAIATPYYRNGDIFNYIRLHPNADCLDLVHQIASALAYIHSKDVVHGNICPVSFSSSVLPSIFCCLGFVLALTNVICLGKHLHSRRRHDARDRHSREHPCKPGDQQTLSICSVKLDV